MIINSCYDFFFAKIKCTLGNAMEDLYARTSDNFAEIFVKLEVLPLAFFRTVGTNLAS
jgi:hypothetical protein